MTCKDPIAGKITDGLYAGVLLFTLFVSPSAVKAAEIENPPQVVLRPNLKNAWQEGVSYRGRTHLPWMRQKSKKTDFENGFLARAYGFFSGCRPIGRLGTFQIAFKIILE